MIVEKKMNLLNIHSITGKLMTVDKVRGSRKSPSSLSKDFISTKSCVGETTLETQHSNKQKDSNSPTTPAVERNHASGRKEVCVTTSFEYRICLSDRHSLTYLLG